MASARPRRCRTARAAGRGDRPNPAAIAPGRTIDLFTYLAEMPAARAPDVAAPLPETLPLTEVVIRDCTLYHADCRDVLPALGD